MYKSRALFGLINEINKQVYLPHIQRAFVWDEEQIGKLFDSLMRGYPIQTFLFWRTKEKIRARKFMEYISQDIDLHSLYEAKVYHEGVEKIFVLDGQQRLQSLYAIYSGGIMNEDKSKKLDAYFDVTESEISDEDGLIHHLRFSSNELDLPFYKIRNLLDIDNQKAHFDIASNITDKLGNLDRIQERVIQKNVSQLVTILREEKYFWIQEIDGVSNKYTYETITDIFVRVNSGGTKLDPSDLMFASLKEEWEEFEENIEEVTSSLNSLGLSFEKSFALKCIMSVLDMGITIDVKKMAGPDGDKFVEKAKANWEALEKTFLRLHDFISIDLKLSSGSLVKSYNIFVPFFEFFYHNPSCNEISKSRMRAAFYKAHLYKWFQSKTDAVLSFMLGKVKSAKGAAFPLKEIELYFDSIGRQTIFQEADSLIPRHRGILLNLLYSTTHGHDAFRVKCKENLPQADHIYPKSKLRDMGISESEINGIGNFRYIGALDNNKKRAENPDSYFSRLLEAGIDVSRHILVEPYCSNPKLLAATEDAFNDFYTKRNEKVIEIITNTLNV